MFSVMIVDDEKAIRENLPRIINFEEFGSARRPKTGKMPLKSCRSAGRT